MNRLAKFVISILLVTCAAPIWSQESMTVGDVKAKNAKLLSKDDLMKLLPGHNYLSTAQSYEQRWTLDPDGTAKGANTPKVASVMQQPAGGEAKWSVNDRGEFCLDGKWYFRQALLVKYCHQVYELGDGYYRFASNAADSSPAYFFQVK